MSESIKDLRRICQVSRETGFYQFGWFEKNFLRKVSIYFTKLFLKMKISANQVTFISLSVGIAAGILFTFGSAQLWVIGALLLYFSQVLDVSDGEVARYNRTASAKGAFWDTMGGLFVWQFVIVCASFGIYDVLQEIVALFFGFAALILLFLYNAADLLPYSILYQEGQLPEATRDKVRVSFKGILRYGWIIFGQGGLFHGILLTSIVDCFLHPFAITGFSLNFKFIYLMSYTTALVIGLTIKIYNVHRQGLKIVRP